MWVGAPAETTDPSSANPQGSPWPLLHSLARAPHRPFPGPVALPSSGAGPALRCSLGWASTHSSVGSPGLTFWPRWAKGLRVAPLRVGWGHQTARPARVSQPARAHPQDTTPGWCLLTAHPHPLPTTSGLWHLLRPPCGPSPASPVPGLRPGPCPAPTGWLLPSFPHDGWLGPLLQEPPPTSPDPLLLPTPHTPCRAGKVNAKEVGRPERSLLLAVVWGKRAPPEGREPSLGVAHSRQHPWPPWTACLPHLPPPRQSSGTAGPGFPLPLSGPPTLTGTSPPCPRPTAHSPARGGQPRRCPAGSLPSPAEQDRSQAQRQHGVSCLSFCQEPPGAAAQSLGGHEGRQLR